MFKKYFKKIIIAAIPFLLLSAALSASAADIIPACGETGDCQVNDFLILAKNISNWILGVVGSVVLLFFIYGGFLFIFSAGDSGKVEEGKNMLVGSIVGLVIVFASFIIIQFAMEALGIKSGWQISGWFGK